MGAIEIAAAGTKGLLKEFVEFPYRLYQGDPFWVPPLRIAVNELLDREKHPFYANAEAELFLARSGGETVGRIAAIVDRNHNRTHEEEAGMFGFFECVNRQDVAQALLAKAREWTAGRGARFLRGPVNPSTNYECALLVDGFDSSPMVMMPYNFSYYGALLEGCGLKKARDLVAYYSDVPALDVQRIGRVADRSLKQQGISVRPINIKDFQADVDKIWEVYNAAWERNWGFVPMTREEFMLTGKEMKQILKPELVLLGEKQGRVVAFALCLPDVNYALKPAGGKLFPAGLLKILYHQRLVKNVRVLALGVEKEFRTTGIAAAFYAQLIRAAKRLGYTGAEMSWILEENVLMRRSLEAMGAKLYKTYRIYDWN